MRTLATIAMAVVVAATAPVAFAHEDTGEIQILRADTVEPLSIELEVSIIYNNDDEPAEDATVTAVAEQSGVAPGAPVELAVAGGGIYSGQITVPGPGTWTVRVTSLSPSATAETTVEVAPPATTTTAVRPTTTPAEVTSVTEVADADDANGGSRQNPLIPIVSTLAVLGLGFVVWRGARRGRRDDQ